MKEQIEVITYEQDRLNYFTDLMNKAQERYKRLFKKHKDAPYLSDEAQALSDAGRETHFLGDVVELLEKGAGKQSEGLANDIAKICPDLVESGCGGFNCIACLTRQLEHMGYGNQREGEWREDVVAFCNVCSSCRAMVDRYAIKCNSGKLHYCPNCGAKMKGADNE